MTGDAWGPFSWWRGPGLWQGWDKYSFLYFSFYLHKMLAGKHIIVIYSLRWIITFSLLLPSFSSMTLFSLSPTAAPHRPSKSPVVAGVQRTCFLLSPAMRKLLSHILGRAQGYGSVGWCLPDFFSLQILSTFISDKEFFFLANEISLCKIAPKGWSKQPQKTSWSAFILFLRIKFFVSHNGLLQWVLQTCCIVH